MAIINIVRWDMKSLLWIKLKEEKNKFTLYMKRQLLQWSSVSLSLSHTSLKWKISIHKQTPKKYKKMEFASGLLGVLFA